jgi:hypothetical protein
MSLLRTMLVACAIALIAVDAAAATPSPHHTKRQAERNLLGATRLLLRWHTNLVNRRSGLLAQNTTAKCAGMGHAYKGGFTKFTCTLQHGKVTVRVLYYAQRKGGFEAHRLKKTR